MCSDRHFIATTTPYTYMTVRNVDNNGAFHYTGLCMDVINSFAKRNNLTFTIIEPNSKRNWGTESSDGNWTGMIGQVRSGEADIGASVFSMTEERSKVVNYTPMFYDDSFVLVLKKVKVVSNGVFDPLNARVWLLWMLLVLSAIAIFYCFSLISITVNKKLSFYDIMFNFISGHLANSVDLRVAQTLPMRIIYLSFIFSNLFLIFAYNSNLRALFAVHQHPKQIESLQELLDQPDIQLKVRNMSLFTTIIANGETQLFRSAWARINEREDNLIPSNLIDNIYDELINMNGRAGVIISRSHVEHYLKGNYSELYIAKQSLVWSGLHFIWRKTFRFGDILGRELDLLRASGQCTNITPKHVETTICSSMANWI